MNSKGFLSNIERKKKFFREPKKAGDVDKLLSEYEAAIRLSKSSLEGNGALLTCVIGNFFCIAIRVNSIRRALGGKLSEGINFSNDLARCVVVIGMPFANSHSKELQERMSFLNKSSVRALITMKFHCIIILVIDAPASSGRESNTWSTILRIAMF